MSCGLPCLTWDEKLFCVMAFPYVGCWVSPPKGWSVPLLILGSPEDKVAVLLSPGQGVGVRAD